MFWRRKRDHDWQIDLVIWPKKMIDGTERDGPVFKRRVNGQVEYRAPTQDELDDCVSGDAW